MALMELFGCALVTFSPALAMFVFTIARHPLKIIILTCSAFFWLLSLLLSAVVWYAVVPLQQHLAFGMVVAVIFQEAMRVGFYYLLKRAETGLQKIAMAEESPEGVAVASPDAISAAVSAGYDNEVGIVGSSVMIDAASTSAVVVGGNQDQADGQTADRTGLTPANRFYRILNLRELSYVCGLGFGFMSGAFAMVNLLADMSGPGTVGLDGEHEAFLLVSAFLALAFVCLNICWTVLTFVCLEDRKLYFLAAVWVTHMLCSMLTLLNNKSKPLMSLAPGLAALACLIGCSVLMLVLLGASVSGFLLSLVSPAWMCSWRQPRRG